MGRPAVLDPRAGLSMAFVWPAMGVAGIAVSSVLIAARRLTDRLGQGIGEFGTAAVHGETCANGS
jgi:hypothetical protein